MNEYKKFWNQKDFEKIKKLYFGLLFLENKRLKIQNPMNYEIYISHQDTLHITLIPPDGIRSNTSYEFQIIQRCIIHLYEEKSHYQAQEHRSHASFLCYDTFSFHEKIKLYKLIKEFIAQQKDFQEYLNANTTLNLNNNPDYL